VGELAGQLWGKSEEDADVVMSGKGRSEEEERLRALKGGRR
jgi:hypothetical protein